MSPVTRRSYSDGRDTLLPASFVVVETNQVERPKDSGDDPDLATDGDSYATMLLGRKVLLSTMRRRPPPPAVSTVPLAASAPQCCGHGHARACRLFSNILKSYQNTTSLLIASESKLMRLMSFNQPN
jgi:hypothetical protein